MEDFVGGLLWGIITLLFVFWVLGFALHFGGSLIHLLLIVIAVMVVINLISGRGARV
ncbi:MAG: hypothetical protein NVSMB21_19050 [Vulcanimicrobiaceae bacterium]